MAVLPLSLVEAEEKRKEGRGEEGGVVRHTALDPRLLPLVDGELLQLLLVRVAQASDVDVGEAASEAVHYFGCDVWLCG